MANGNPARRWTFFGFWLPALIILFAGGGVAALWLKPGDTENGRMIMSIMIGVLALILLTAWAVLFSGWRWYTRVLLLLVEAGAALVIVPGIVFDGEMRPHVRWPWEAKPDDVVAKHRQEQVAAKASGPVDVTIGPYDSPEFRGRRRDGVAEGPKLSRDWQKKPPKLLWKQPCGLGWSSFGVAGNVAITMEQRHENEAVVAYDIDTGREVWKYEYPARFVEPLGGIGPRTTPTIFDRDVYSLGATGHFVCLDGKTGKHKWSMNVLDGRPNLEWAMAGSPLIVGNAVVVNPGRQSDDVPHNTALIALDRERGLPAWQSGEGKAGYSSPMLGTITGQRQLVLLEGKQVAGYDAKDGKPLWSFPWDRTNRDINVAQPLVLDDGRIFISAGYGIGCVMLQIGKDDKGAWQATPIWQKDNKPLRCKFSGPVEYHGFIYGLDEGILACIDARDGRLCWREGRYGHGQLVRYDNLLILLSEKGELVLVEATPEEHRELGKVKAIDAPRTWNVPALANGRIFVRNDQEMACFDLRE